MQQFCALNMKNYVFNELKLSIMNIEIYFFIHRLSHSIKIQSINNRYTIVIGSYVWMMM